jgi:type I restriction enzyme S subunit
MAELRQPVWLKPDEVPPLPSGWRAMPTEEACIQMKPGKLFDSKTVAESGGVPVLNQSETGILGYHNEEPGVVASSETPVVTFANHTCAMRLMKQPFSTIQNIFPKVGKPGITDTTYFYYAALAGC